MKENPLVSAVINCYNGEKYLKEAIVSVYAQTYQNWEIIFWDNASTDQTATIAKSYDKKLRYFSSKETSVLGKARVLAVNEAKGDFLAFLDSDDLWLPDKLIGQVEIMSVKINVGVVYGRAELINGEGKNIGYSSPQYKQLPTGNVFSELVKYNFIPFVSALVPKNIYYECGGFPSGYKNSTDYELFLSISYKYEVHCIDEVICSYRLHGVNLSSKQKVISAQESISTVSKFLPSASAKAGLQYQYIELFVSSIREFNFSMLFCSVLRIRRFDLLLYRIYIGLKSVLIKVMD